MAAGDQRARSTRKRDKRTIVVRALLAPWILFVTVVLCVNGDWWGLVFVPFLAVDLWLLRRLVRDARSQATPKT